MKKKILTELGIDTLHQLFYGGMTAEEHDEEGKPEEARVQHRAPRRVPASSRSGITFQRASRRWRVLH